MFTPLLAIGLPAGSEWILILLVILLLFGGSKIPQLMRGMGRGVSEFKEGIDEGKRAFDKGLKGEPEDNGVEKP